MTLLRWRDSLSLNVPIIDSDHKKLFELLNRVRFLDLAGDEPQAIADALSELLLYTQTHFRREEKLMELGNYPGLERHRQYHRFSPRRWPRRWRAFARARGASAFTTSTSFWPTGSLTMFSART